MAVWSWCVSGYTNYFPKFNKKCFYSVYINKTKETPITFCKGAGCTAITDTSSNNILGPKDDIDQIHDAINAKPFYLDRYTVILFLV